VKRQRGYLQIEGDDDQEQGRFQNEEKIPFVKEKKKRKIMMQDLNSLCMNFYL